jgi:large subunit ribosomal protein L9
MQILLREDVRNVGKKGDIVTVSDGYARNMLLPRGKALLATPGVQHQAVAMRAARVKRDAAEKVEAEELGKQLTASAIVVMAKAGNEGRLFGSIGAADVAKAVASARGVSIDRKVLVLDEPIKTVGTHFVEARLHTEVSVRLELTVQAK